MPHRNVVMRAVLWRLPRRRSFQIMQRWRAALAVALAVVGAGTSAHEFSAGTVTVAHPWARATPGGAKVGAAYMEIRAASGGGDRLLSAKVDPGVADRVEVHATTRDGGVMRMRRIETLPVPAGKSVLLGPSGNHLMLVDLKHPLKEGDLLKLTLVFEKAGAIEVDATVEPLGAAGPHGFDHQPGTPAAKTPKGGHQH